MSLSTTARPRGRTRISLAVVALLGLLGLVFAPAAVAATSVTYNGSYAGGHAVRVNGGVLHNTTLFRLDVDGGGTLRAYCVGLNIPITVGDTYEIDPLTTQVSNPSKVLWILQNSYPSVSIADLTASSGVPALNATIAIAATQAAIWHFSDGSTLDAQNREDVKALYAYLIGPANVGATSQPAPTLSISPATKTSTGGRVGPFTISFSGSTPVDLTTNPAFTIFDAATGGNAVTTASNGDQVWIEVPAGTLPGDVVLSATGSAPVGGGWYLSNPDRPNEVQPLAFAGTQTLSASSNATITVVTPSTTPPPTDPATTPPPTTTPPTTTTPPATTPPATTTPPTSTTPPVTEPATTPPPTTSSPAGTPSSTKPGLADTGSSSSGVALTGIAALLLGAGAMVLGSTRRQGSHH